MKPHAFVLLILCMLVAFSSAALRYPPELEKVLFTQYATLFRKQYETKDFLNRFNIWRDNYYFVLRENANRSNTFKLAINQFSDLTLAEFHEQISNGLTDNYPHHSKYQQQPQPFVQLTTPKHKLPETVDLSDYTGKAKDQGNCGACYAFSAISTIETGLAMLQDGQQSILSEQHMIDCATECQGCYGGYPQPALDWARNGVCENAGYEYQAVKGQCRNDCNKLAHVTNVRVVNASSTCDYHLQALSDVQTQLDEHKVNKRSEILSTISMGIYGSSSYFQHYSSGVLNKCGIVMGLTHAVTAVGYGVDNDSGLQYMLIKNSWSESWGESGYIRISTQGNQCGICTSKFDRQPVVWKN